MSFDVLFERPTLESRVPLISLVHFPTNAVASKFFKSQAKFLFQKFAGQNLVLLYKKKTGLHSDLMFFFAKNRWKQKKGLHSGFDRLFLPKASEDQKQKNPMSFRWILWDSPISKYIRNSRTCFCNSQRQRGSINQQTNAENFGGPLVARGPRVGRPWTNESEVLDFCL